MFGWAACAWAGRFAADGQVIHLDLELPEQAEATPFGFSDQPSLSITFTQLPGRPRDEVGPFVEGPLDLRCVIEDRALRVEVRSVMSRYPRRLPEELTCAIGGLEAQVAIRRIRALYPDPAALQVDPARGIEVRRYPVAPGTTQFNQVWFAPPAGAAWPIQEGTVEGEGGGSWTDVTCSVVKSGAEVLLQVGTTSLSPSGRGSCRLRGVGDSAITVPVALADVPKDPVLTIDE